MIKVKKGFKDPKIKYSKADPNHLNAIISVFSDAIIEMEKNDIHQWDEVYPDKSTIENDIANQQMYIGIVDGDVNRIAVCFVLSEECDDQYSNGKWNYPDSKFCVIHRLCVNPEFQNCGVATNTMKYIENLCKKEGYETIRLDFFTKNPFAKKLYEKTGYSVVGTANWRKGLFELGEKKL